jgi:hypothetical protein
MTTSLHLAADLAIWQKFNLARSPAWPDVERDFRIAHPNCAACGESKQVNVHHKFPFHYVVLCGRPDLELDPRNLVTFCIRADCQHHILLGHLDDYQSYNPQAVKFFRLYSGKTGQQIRADAAWKLARAAKPKHVDQMTQKQKDAFKRMLDRKYPPHAAMLAKVAMACSLNLVG